MASGDFKFIAIEIPRDLTLEKVRKIKSRINAVPLKDCISINKVLQLDPDDYNIGDNAEDLEEDDLFNICDEDLKEKGLIRQFLMTAIDEVLLPRVNAEKRSSSKITSRSFAYLDIEGKLYVASGALDSYYSSKFNEFYLYILAINLSGILDE